MANDKEQHKQEIIQPLYWMVPLGRWICRSCNDCNHNHCELYNCDCACRDPRKPKVKVVRDRDGLSKEEREAQHDFPFGDYEPLKV